MPDKLTPFWIMCAQYDALDKRMPGDSMANSLRSPGSISEDRLGYEFRRSKGLKFHNDDRFMAADVAPSFRRAKGVHPKNRSRRL